MGVYRDYTDHQLVQLLFNNDRLAFEELYDRYWLQLYYSANYILKDADVSKDVVQDIFLWIWENRTSLQIVNVKAYLKSAVRFKVANLIRSGNIRESFFNEVEKISVSQFAVTAEEAAELKELQQIIHETILQLPKRCREVYIMSRMEGLSNQEIAGKLGISPKTVEAQMTIALKRLRLKLDFRRISILILCSALLK